MWLPPTPLHGQVRLVAGLPFLLRAPLTRPHLRHTSCRNHAFNHSSGCLRAEPSCQSEAKGASPELPLFGQPKAALIVITGPVAGEKAGITGPTLQLEFPATQLSPAAVTGVCAAVLNLHRAALTSAACSHDALLRTEPHEARRGMSAGPSEHGAAPVKIPGGV